MNAIARKNRERLRIRHAIKHAPMHAAGIESRMVGALLQAHDAHATVVRRRVLEFARHRLRRDERKRLPKTSRHLARQMHAEAERAAKDVTKKVAKAIGQKKLDVDLTRQVAQLTDRVLQLHAEYDELAARRANDILTEWSDLSERSPRFGDLDALSDMLDDGADAVASRMAQSIRMAFGQSWAEMNQAAQVQAGVEQYVWATMMDAHVRGPHASLHESVCDWDDPPLKAELASCGEDCHAGEDYECRCLAAPLPGEATEQA